MSDDGEHGVTVIAFIGSVFSPYYAWARRGDVAADPLNHCALNVAVHGLGGKHWAMTERGKSRVRRTPTSLHIGPSAVHWKGGTLVIHIDEVTVPWPSRLRGVIRLHPASVLNHRYALDAQGRHRWGPIAPRAHVEVELSQPALRWRGAGYLDSNDGDVPLEHDFARWDWSRSHLSGGRCAVLYDVIPRSGDPRSLALTFGPGGEATAFTPPPASVLPHSLWRIARGTRSDAGTQAAVSQTLVDAPFYARSLVETHLLGEPVTSVHEGLSLDRFSAPLVQMMLPFRMPRTSR